jgi:probable rRNA maturation factor
VSAEISVDVAVEGPDWPEGSEELAVRAAQAAYRDQADPKAPTPIGVAILLSDDATVQAMNKEFRAQDKPTNVLSFPNDDSPLPGEVAHLGDMALALETLQREARSQEKNVNDHLTHLVVHAMLHLMGMDHEADHEAEVMEACEIAILKTHFGIENPYREETA